MVKIEFLEDQPNVVKKFYSDNDLTEPSIYLIAVGAFEGDELASLFTVTKPPKNTKKYTFVVNSCPSFRYLKEMIDYFHLVYDGLIEGLE